MSRKSQIIAGLIKGFEGQDLDARYLAFFGCFNQQRFYEAHEVLEALWLEGRQRPDGAFYKGLIQLAGAFVHVQKGRAGPAIALFKLAQMNLKQFPPIHHRLMVEAVLEMIRDWLRKLEDAEAAAGAYESGDLPRLTLHS